VQVDGPAEWAAITELSFNNTNTTFSVRHYPTQLVARGAMPDARLGPWPFPPQRGRLSTAALDFIRDGATELWPDWEASDVPRDVRPGNQLA
jgi:hypothetical protein